MAENRKRRRFRDTLDIERNVEDPCRILGVDPWATEDEIRSAFRTRAKSLHPDINPSPNAAEEFTRARAAFETLIDRRKAVGGMDGEKFGDEERLAARVREFRRRMEKSQSMWNAEGSKVMHESPWLARFANKPDVILRYALGLGVLLTGYFLLRPEPNQLERRKALDELSAKERRKLIQSIPAAVERVEAWWHPSRKRWETPAPWDPVFVAHRDTTAMVPRDDVVVVSPPDKEEQARIRKMLSSRQSFLKSAPSKSIATQNQYKKDLQALAPILDEEDDEEPDNESLERQ